MKAYLVFTTDDQDTLLVSQIEYDQKYNDGITKFNCIEVDMDTFPITIWKGIARPTPMLLKLLSEKIAS